MTDRDKALEAHVAEHIMGWQRWKISGRVELYEPSAERWLPDYNATRTTDPFTECDTSMHKFSVDMNAAMKVVAKMYERFSLSCRIAYASGSQTCVAFYLPVGAQYIIHEPINAMGLATCDTPAKAICEAALLAEAAMKERTR